MSYKKSRHIFILLLAVIALIPLTSYSQDNELPSGENTVSGAVSVDRSTAGTLNINSASERSIVEWQAFNIGQTATVNINQPQASSAFLNRVVGGDPSTIAGALNSNGQVFVVNPNGIFFTPTSRVDVAGIVASTLDISNDDFLNGNYNFFKHGESAFILNQGKIVVKNGGYVALLSQAVENQGVIIANLGSVVMAAGEKMIMALDDLGQISVDITDAVQANVFGKEAAVKNSGTIIANGGKVLLTAKVLNGIFDYAINNSGIIQAGSLENHKGVIELCAQGAPIINKGDIRVDGSAFLADAGKISIEAATILQQGNISANAFEGGDAGEVSIVSQTQTTLDNNSATEARALGIVGNGGRILINSTGGNTVVDKNAVIDVSAGAVAGNAGFIEISAYKQLGFFGILSGRAPPGYLYATIVFDDPDYLTIDSPINQASSYTAGAKIDIYVNADITVTNGDITLTADSDHNNVGDFVQLATATITANNGSVTISGANVTANNIIATGSIGLSATNNLFINVKTTYNDSNPATKDFGSIQTAINAIVSGTSTINVAAGTYNITQIVINKSLTLTGAGMATTIIDGGKVTTLPSAGMVRIQNVTTGPVVIQGFTLQNPGHYITISEDTIAAVVMRGDTSPVTVQNNHLIGYNNSPADQFDMGLWSYSTDGALTIQNNEFEKMWQAVLLECPRGGATVQSNTFHNLLPANDGTTLYEPMGVFALTYNSENVAAAMVFNSNTFRDFSGSDISIGGGYPDSGVGQFSNVQITNNTINAIGSGLERRHVGIILINYGTTSANAALSGVINATISGNTITGTDTTGYSKGIWLNGPNNNVLIQNNTITGVNKGIISDEKYTGAGFSTGAVAHLNSFSGNAIAVSNASADPANIIDATKNYWGSATPAFTSIILGTADYSPWLGASFGTSPMTWYTNDNIQDAIDAASSGDTVKIAAGTYDETIDINKRIALQGAGSSLTGTVLQSTINPTLINGSPYSYKPVVIISASGIPDGYILLKDLMIRPRQDLVSGAELPGILPRPGYSISYVELNNVHIIGTQSAGTAESGITVDNNTNLNHLVVSNCEFRDMAYGIIFFNTINTGTMVQNVEISDTTFDRNSIKGFYAEKLSDATFTNVAVTNNGNIALTPDWADPNNAGIDINLKFGDYQNLVFNNLTVTGNGIGSTNGVGLAVKARGTGSDSSYSSRPATLVGVTVNRGTFTGNEAAIRFGEPNKGNTGPTNITIKNAAISGNTQFALSNVLSGVTVDATDNNTFDGVNPATATNAQLFAIEDKIYHKVDNSSVGLVRVKAGNIYVTTNSGSIQRGIDAGGSGDTVNVAAGTYDEQVVITKSLTLQGAGDTTIIKPSSAAKLTQVFDGLFWYGGTKQIAGIIVANVPDGSSVTLKNLKVDESSVTSKPTGADYLTGIFYRETGGTVDTVTIAGTGAWSGSDRAYGMYLSAATNPVTVEIKGSSITNFDKNGIEVMGNKLNANIHNNTITGRGPTLLGDEIQNGVNVGRDAVATVNFNTISNLSYQPETYWSAGIMFYHYLSTQGKAATANGNTITDSQIGIIFINANATAEDNTVSGGTVGLLGLSAEPDQPGAWAASFIGNTISGAKDSPGYENAAIDIQTFDAGASLTATIRNNQVLGGGSTNADGIYIGGSAGGTTATISNNTISGWQNGINLLSLVSGATSIYNNSIAGNTKGINNQTATLVNASGNWLGTNTPAGVKAAVSTNVDYTPWLDSGANSSAGPGFQGNFSNLWVDDDSPQTGSTGKIQEGINSVTTAAGTINVAAGTYAEQLNINKSLTLSGADKTTTFLDGSNLGDTSTGIKISADNVTITKLAIKNYNIGIDISGVNSATINNNAFAGNATYHVRTTDAFNGKTLYDIYSGNNNTYDEACAPTETVAAVTQVKAIGTPPAAYRPIYPNLQDTLNDTQTSGSDLDLVHSGDLNISGNDVNTNGGDLNITNTGGTVTLGPVDAAGGDINITNTGGTVELGSVVGGGGNIDITADSITLTSDITGTGDITLQPNTTNRPIIIGADGGVGDFALNTTEIGYLGSGFSHIYIGSLDGNGPITVNTVTFNAPVTIQAPASGGSITVDGTITSNSPVILIGSGATTILNADIITAGAPITINDSVILGTPATVTLDTTNGGSSTGADIQITGTINDDNDPSGLVLNAGTSGAIDLQSSVGNTTPPAKLAASANNIISGGNIHIAGDTSLSVPNGVITATGNPLNVSIDNGGFLTLNIGAKVGLVSGTLTGTIMDLNHILFANSSFPSSLYPPGNVYWNGSRIWPSASAFLNSQESGGLILRFALRDVGQLSNFQVNSFDTPLVGVALFYHPLTPIDMSAFESVFTLEEGAYQFIDGNLGIVGHEGLLPILEGIKNKKGLQL